MRAEDVASNEIGYYRVFAKPPGGTRREITMFRGAPTKVGSITTADPFTDISLSLEFPQITVFDRPGVGDLDWFVPYCDIDVLWENTGSYDYNWQWEGFIMSLNFSLTGASSGWSVECKGAALLLDNYLASPMFPQQPIPYELLIRDAFDQDKHPARLARLVVNFPDDWDRVVPAFDDKAYLGFLKPWGVREGQKWTGLTARATGAWDVVLTAYVQGLLSIMYDSGGSQWTIRMQKGRKPVLHLREVPDADNPEILVVDLLNPGVELSGSRDYSQSANVIYGEGSDTAGVTFSGMTVTPDGTSTRFTPFASSQNVYPPTHNPAFDENAQRKEIHIKFPPGLDETACDNTAKAQLQRFADPGITGTLTLTSDVVDQTGQPFPAKLIKAGRTVRIKGLFGLQNGVLAHVTQAVATPGDKTELTIDSKYRDQMTVAEVQARTRDALTPLRALQVGKYSNTVQDLLFPWSYTEGSGIMPNAGDRSAKEFFQDLLPSEALFPYEEFTKKHPPSAPHSQQFYIKIPACNHDEAGLNWAGELVATTYQSPTQMFRSIFNVDSPAHALSDSQIKIFYSKVQPAADEVSLHDIWIETDTGKKWIAASGRGIWGAPDNFVIWENFSNPNFDTIIGWEPSLHDATIRMGMRLTAPVGPSENDIWIKRDGDGGSVFIYTTVTDGGISASTWREHIFPPPSTRRKYATPVRFSAAGSIRLSQIAAYDGDGNVKPVRFHVSIYGGTIDTGAMPQIYEQDDGTKPPYLHPPGGDNYKIGQTMPFFENAFESIQPNGEQTQIQTVVDSGTAPMAVGWGNYFEPAGYWPGRASRGAARTGLLVDETAWTYDLTRNLPSLDDRKSNLQDPDAAMLYVMIYCDDSDTPTYFMGRFLRAEPGAS